jgi:electron transfer flavoprotein alpha subunit
MVMSEIWTISEEGKELPGLIAHAKGVCRGDDKVVAWTCSSEAAQTAATRGADLVYRLTNSVRPEEWVDVIVKQAREVAPVALFFGPSKRCKELAARVGAELDAALSTECIAVAREDGISAQRYVYGGLFIATEVASTVPFVATMAKGSAIVLPESTPAEIDELEVLPSSSLRVIEFREREGETNLADARTIVCVGRGVSTREGLELAERLATVMSGALGCTRPVAEELHWLPEEQYIGMSGQTVKPDLYLGLGVSGQVQHMSGLRDAKFIVGVDQNENAPIVAAADYALIGDLYEIVPLLLESLSS